MTTEKETEQDRKKPLSLAGRGKLELKRSPEAASVRQSFSHGRSKTVTVEVKRKRTVGPEAPKPEVVETAPAAEAKAPGATPARKPLTLRELTEEERAQRVRAVQGAIKADEVARIRAEEDAHRVQEEARHHAEEESLRAAEEAQARAVEAAAAEPASAAEPAGAAAGTGPARVERDAASQKVAVDAAAAAAKARPAGREAEEEEETANRVRRPGVPVPRRPTPVKRGEPRRRTGKMTVTQALSAEENERTRSIASVKRARERERMRQQQTGPEKVIRDVVIPDAITVQDLAARMAERGADVIKSLMRMGVMATINQVIDADTAELIVTEFGHTPKRQSESDVEVGLKGEADVDAALLPRAPVVTVMGHVDHGKTSLLDALRSTDVAAHEAGGITQHIGAYRVTLASGDQITFIDTPGHEAFTEMRARGATVTDIVVLVVAADDGIMPQTVEAIMHAKAANVPIIVAINKIDKPEANAQRVRTDLLQHGLVVEELGGDVLAIEVSAKTGQGLDKLQETILLQAEILDLRANPDRTAEGVVIEAALDRGRGPVATVLIKRGTLHVGDIFVAGSEWGRVRALVDDHGNQVKDAGPSMPVEVLGLQGTPSAGDELSVVDSESRARDVSDFRRRRRRDAEVKAGARGTVEQMLSKIAAGEAKELPVVIKTDVQGSLEAIVATLNKLATEEVTPRVLHAGVGAISESDVTLAKASSALIIAFNVRANSLARELARRDGVDIRYYSVIYNVIDDVKQALGGMLAPRVRENFLGYAEIRQVFDITKVGKVAGCRVTEGVVRRGNKVRLLRDNVVIHEGTLKTLRRFKDEVREVQAGFECGMAFENYTDIKEGDQIECFEMVQETRTL
ncbi:MAG TPA: translation initiation factor IF-2 [Candidatus Sulfotelmatobacter sp.]|nr:translation initiation factor IF-2 [Candidatus Sulfotelmatobacter sp.]